MSKRYALAILAYLLPTFALGFVWHLVLFKDYYESLAIYRTDIIIPLGFGSSWSSPCSSHGFMTACLRLRPHQQARYC